MVAATIGVGKREAETQAYLALPARGRGAGVLVLHAWWGLNDDFRRTCDRLAAAGFVAMAPDLYSGRTATTVEDAERLLDAGLPQERIRYVEAAAEALRRHPAVVGQNLGVVGFSMGANYAVWLSTLRPDIRAVVTFYGGSEEEYPDHGNTAFLAHFAEHDRYEPEDAVRALREQFRSNRIRGAVHVYRGTGHWFFEPGRAGAYDADAADLAWRRTITFLHDQIG